MRGLAVIGLCVVVLGSPAVAKDDVQAEPGVSQPESLDQRKPAEMRADQLDTLFARLYTSDGGDAAHAIEQKIWALWTTPDSPTAEALLQQATKAMNDGAPRESLSILNRLIGTYPDFAEAWNKRATLYYLMKRDDEALLDIQRVLDLEPRHFGALSGRGLIYQRQKKYSAAIEAFRAAIKINPGMDSVKDALKELEKLEQGI